MNSDNINKYFSEFEIPSFFEIDEFAFENESP